MDHHLRHQRHLPVVLVIARYGGVRWRDLTVAPAVVLALVVVLYVIDCVPNGMVNPMFTLCAGALATLAAGAGICETQESMESRLAGRVRGYRAMSRPMA